MKSKHNQNNAKKFKIIPKPLTSSDRLNEIGALLCVAIWRQVQRKRENLLQKPLDFSSKWSVTAASSKYGEARYAR